MSIQDEINRIEQNIANTYSALNSMGATMPAEQNSNNLASTARTVPQSGGGGGETVEEIVYVNVLFDFSTFSIVSIDKTYAEIIALVEAGKYVVMRAKYALISAPVNVAYFPLSANGVEQNTLLFTGMLNASLNGQQVFLSLSAFIYSNDRNSVKVRVVSTTDVN